MYTDQALRAAQRTTGTQLHIVEFWMPQHAAKRNCQLDCVHCYVPKGGRTAGYIMTKQEYLAVLDRLMDYPAYLGKWDVVFPGMEPLLPRNHDILFAMCERAHERGSRSVGITTNGLLLAGDTLKRVADSPVSTVNVSLDGPEAIHDAQRGAPGLFAKTIANVKGLCTRAPHKKVITNTTITRLNSTVLGAVIKTATDLGCTYAAFHPYETARNAEHSLALTRPELLRAIEAILTSFAHGLGSVVLEFEASTAGAFFDLCQRGAFRDFEFVADETGFLFFRKLQGCHELLVNAIVYPHHFIRTIRVLDDGSLSSCRRMALSGWRGVGDLRQQSLDQILAMPETLEAAAQIWEEFIDQVPAESLNQFLEEAERR